MSSPASDVWQLGCLLWEIVAGDFLFGDWCFPGGWGEFYLTVCKEDAGGLPLDKQVERISAWAGGELWDDVLRLMRGCLLREGGRRVGAAQLVILGEAVIKNNGS